MLVVLDGRPIRDHKMDVHAGHGQCVSYLELTDQELDSLVTGPHEIGLLFPTADDLYSVDVQLLTYAPSNPNRNTARD